MSVITEAQLNTNIDADITTNNNNEITGAQLNAILSDMVDSSVSRKGTNNTVVLDVADVASGVNYLKITNAITGALNHVTLSAEGDADRGIKFHDSNGNILVDMRPVSGAVNYILLQNRATGQRPVVLSEGEDNTGLTLSDSNGNEILDLLSVASAVNELTITNAATGNPPIIKVAGESNVGMIFQDSNGNNVIEIPTFASIVNSLKIECATTGADLRLFVTGESGVGMVLYDSDTNAMLKLSSAGVSSTNYIDIKSNTTAFPPTIRAAGTATRGIVIFDSNDNEMLNLASAASAINNLQIINAAAGNDPSIISEGGDTDITMRIFSKGAGYIENHTSGIVIVKSAAAHGLILDGDGGRNIAFAYAQAGNDWSNNAEAGDLVIRADTNENIVIATEPSGSTWANGILINPAGDVILYGSETIKSSNGDITIDALTGNDVIISSGGGAGTGGVIIKSAQDSHCELTHNSASGSPFISFYQTTTRRGFLQYINSSGGMRLVTEATNGDVFITPNGTGAISVSEVTDYENNVTADDDIPNKKWIDDKSYFIDTSPYSFDNIDIDTNTISSTNVNGDIIIDPNGTGAFESKSWFNIDLGATGSPRIQFNQNSINRAYISYNDSGDSFWINNLYGSTTIFGGSGGSSTQQITCTNNTVNMPNLPTSSAGLNSGDLWNDSGTVKIA
jgi:hypothetical protein